MAGLAHDVSRELRDPHGRWTKGGAALRRIAKEAADAQTPEGTLAKVRTVEPGKGKQINGHWVDRPAEEGHKYRVKLKKPGERGRDTKVYETPEEAATALHNGSHIGTPEPPRPRPPAGPPTTRGHLPPLHGRTPQGASWEGEWNPANEEKAGTRESAYNKLLDNGNKPADAAYMISGAKAHGTSEVIDGLFVQHDPKTDTYKVHVFVVPGSGRKDIEEEKRRQEEQFRKEIKPGSGIVHPMSLDIARGAGISDPAKAKTMRQQVLKATTNQAQYTPDLVGKTQVTITKAPHGRRGTSTLASHTGVGNTLHVKPEVLVGSNAQAVLDHGRSSGWWVPTDKKHDLSMNVMTHEFGHGVHGMLSQKGIIQTTRHNPSATGKPEQDFWRGFAAAINREEPFSVQPPKTETDAYGRTSMDVGGWISRNKAAIKRHVSTYGGANQNEMMAELWTEYALSSAPRAPAKYFGDYVMKRTQESGA